MSDGIVSERIVIIGGGLAGLAAAVGLAGRGHAVTLLESRPRLGGRASSFVDQATGTAIDNCQHVSMGCCTNFRHFCRTVGIERFFRREPELYFIGPEGRADVFSANRLPAPLHLLSAFRRLSYLSLRDKVRLASGLRALARVRNAHQCDEPFDRWLAGQQQTPAAIERFWQVVLVSALSESLDRISVGHARKVFVDAFLANRDGWQVEIPTVPLDELYGQHLTRWLEDRGVTIRLQAGVERLELQQDRIAAVVLRNGERLEAEQFILAVPRHRVPDLLPEGLRSHPQLAGVAQLESAPIASVHLWFERPVTELPHAVLVDRLSQWVFNRTMLMSGPPACEGGSGNTGHYYQVVISASRHLAGRSQEETIAEVVRELTAIWPATAEATLLHARQVTEHRAVFSVRPGVESLRPPQQSPIANLQLAGDWTCTGWPATMEGAVRSGYLAAENVLAHLGTPQRLLQSDLPVSWLAKVLFGL